MSALQAEGDKAWASVDFNAAWFMAWSLFLRRLKPILPSLAVDDAAVTNTLLMALSSDVGLIGVVHREWLSAAHSTAVGRVSAAPVGWERREDVSEVWAELYASLLLHASEEVELLRDEDASTGGDSNFYYLLLSLATLCQQSEQNVSLLWSLEQTTGLIQSCLDQPSKALLFSPLLSPLVSLLTSLTLDRSADCGLRVWELLSDSQSLSWQVIFGIFGQVASAYLPLPPALQQTAAQPPNAISPIESALLCALLSLLTAALSSSEVQALLLGSQGAQYKPLDRLFALLGCRVDTVLKSATLDAINALCAGDRQLCVDVWDRMERAGMLSREDGAVGAVVMGATVVAASKTAGGVGVWYDVEEVESVQRRYMLTIAFSRLVLTLLSTTPLPSPSLTHYLTFLTHHLFLSLSDRQYERPIERWKLTEACLTVAALCIESAAPLQLRDGGHEVDVGLSLVRSLLQGKELLVKLLETLSRAYQLLEAAASATVQPLPSSAGEAGEHVSVLERGEKELVRYVEGSLVAVLRVMWSVMSGESEWMERLKLETGVRAAGGRLYSLSSLLFGHGQEVLVIAHATAYVEGGGSVVGRVMSERERRRRREREEELEAWKGERDEREKRMADEGAVEDSEEDEGGYIPYYSTLLLRHLATASPSRLSNLLLASHLAPDISRSFASLLTSTQLPSHAAQLVESSRIHQARIEAVRLLREGAADGGLGLVLLGFDLATTGESGHGRLELSDRRFALDAIIELVQKPRSAACVHTPTPHNT